MLHVILQKKRVDLLWKKRDWSFLLNTLTTTSSNMSCTNGVK